MRSPLSFLTPQGYLVATIETFQLSGSISQSLKCLHFFVFSPEPDLTSDPTVGIIMGAGCKEVACLDGLPDKVLLRIFSFLKHNEMMKYSVVSKKWRMIAQDSRLWAMVSLRPEISGGI